MRETIKNAALVLSLAAATPALGGPSKEIRDFVAWCSNGLTCEAEVFTSDAEMGGFGLRREAGRAKPVILYFRGGAGLADGSTVFLTVDNKPAAMLPAEVFRRDADDLRLELGNQELVFSSLDALRNGRQLDVGYTGANGKRTVRFSLSGLAGSLTWLDEAQGRIGAKDAIVAGGDKDSPEFIPRDLRSVDDLPEDLKADFTGEGVCALMEPERFGNFGGFEDQFDRINSLLVAPCGDGGAYNQPFAIYWVTDLGEKKMALPAMGADGPIVVDEAWNVDWDPTRKILTGFFKGRGLGDCGMYDVWKLLGVPDDLRFTLVESRQKDDCDGKGGLETFPIVWPVKQK